jgi:hypothetical protein
MNAKEELLLILKGYGVRILCASIEFHDEENIEEIYLQIGYTPEEYKSFLNALDREYDDGYGHQQLFGIVWLPDKIWLSRYEYDGSECWQLNRVPEIPIELFKGDKK